MICVFGAEFTESERHSIHENIQLRATTSSWTRITLEINSDLISTLDSLEINALRYIAQINEQLLWNEKKNI